MINCHLIQGMMRLNDLSVDEVEDLILFDLKHGINFFDTSNIYGNGVSESKIGEVLKRNPDLRKKIILQTKCGIYKNDKNENYYDLSKERIIASCNESLKRLNTNYLDYFLLHRADIFINNKDVAEAFNILYKEGKVKHFGVSNFSSELISYLNDEIKQRIEVNQLQLGLGHLSLISDVFNLNMDVNNLNASNLYFYLKRNNIKIQCWSPFLYGLFKGSIFEEDKFPELNKYLAELGKKYNVSKASIALNFIFKLGDIDVLIGATLKEHIVDCLTSLNYKITKEEWYKLYKIAFTMLP